LTGFFSGTVLFSFFADLPTKNTSSFVLSALLLRSTMPSAASTTFFSPTVSSFAFSVRYV